MEKLTESMQKYNFINNEINSAYHEASLKLGLTDTESLILYSFCQMDQVSQKEVVRCSGLSKQTVSSAVKKMIKDGILQPLKGEKNEALLLTDKGESLVEEKISHIIRAENQVMNCWTEEERQTFIELNKKYLTMFREELKKL